MLECPYSFFFFNDTATTEIYTLSLHDALPILRRCDSPCPPTRARSAGQSAPGRRTSSRRAGPARTSGSSRSEEHTSELQSRLHLVCRLLLEKKKNSNNTPIQGPQASAARCPAH